MNLLQLAVKKQRWDLAAHVIVWAMASVLKNGAEPNGRLNKQKKRGTQG
jgi:hypothetical protein